MRKSVIGLGELCIDIRQKTRWSQTDLAVQLDVKQSTISHWEQTSPTDILRVSPDILSKMDKVLRGIGMSNSLHII